jgi:outer membrane protein TolC
MLKEYRRRALARWLAPAVLLWVGTVPVAAQANPARAGSEAARAAATGDTIRLSLGDALAAAGAESEEVRGAEAQLRGANAQARVARSNLLPQVNTQLVYTKTLRSVFQGAGFEIPDSLAFEPDSTASVEQRLRYLEEKTPNAALGALGGLFGNLPFGRENTWIAAATFAQPLFSGGRIASGVQLAEHAADAAEAQLEDTRAAMVLSVREAYYAARLAEEAEAIVAASVALARDHLARVRLVQESGQASELDVLRAEVELANLAPQLLQAENARQLALLDLKRLVNLPPAAPVVLTTPLDPAAPELPHPDSVALPSVIAAEPLLRRRASVRAAEQQVAIREEQVDIARAAFLPSVALTGNFQRQAFPTGFAPEQWQDDWNVGFAVSWPFFQGFRRGAELDAARADVRQAELQTQQLREGVRMEYEQAYGELERARLQIAAAATTVAQAERVYQLTELRYREGLATQLDVSDARLALQQARMNQANATHDFYRALARAERALGIEP